MKKSGFTMIELIFVIVILGVLAAVAIPKLNATRDDAEQAKAMTNLATLMGDLTSYYTAQGTFADSITSMTNVPLSATGEFKIKDKTCLTFAADKTNGTLTITSPAENTVNPVCKQLIANTSTQNILSGSYACKNQWTVKKDAKTYAVDNSKESNTECTAIANGDASKIPEKKPDDLQDAAKNDTSTSMGIVIQSKMDAFDKTITMSFQGGGVAF